MEISYDTKAQLTTYLSLILVPVLAGVGFAETTANAIVGLLVLLIVATLQVLNERWTSQTLTKENPQMTETIIDESDLDGEEAR